MRSYGNCNSQVDVDIVRITSAFSLLQGWDDVRAQFTGHPTIKPVVADLFPATAPWKVLLCKSAFKSKAKELEDARNWRQEKLVIGEQLDILHSANAQRAAKAKATAQSRVPAHKVAVPLQLPMPQ